MITRKDWYHILDEISTLMITNKLILSEIDAKFGDGDHGITIEKIGQVLKREAESWLATEKPLKALFEAIGSAVLNIGGGSAGPLYGSYFEGLGSCLTDEVAVDAALLKKMFASALSELQFLTKAKVGDKTMMDSIIPATEAIMKAPDDILSIVTTGKEKAMEGAENSKNYASKYGRARMYKEETIGYKDAGAESSSYIFLGFYKALAEA